MLGDRLTSVLRAEDVASVLAYDPELSPDGSVPPDFVWEGERSVVFPASSYSRSMPRHIDAREDADRVLRSRYET